MRQSWTLLRATLPGTRFPLPITLRTPIGARPITLQSRDEARACYAIFGRGEYANTPTDRTALVIGVRAGLAALYFLTRGLGVEVLCYPTDDIPPGLLDGLNDRCVVHRFTNINDALQEARARWRRLDCLVAHLNAETADVLHAVDSDLITAVGRIVVRGETPPFHAIQHPNWVGQRVGSVVHYAHSDRLVATH